MGWCGMTNGFKVTDFKEECRQFTFLDGSDVIAVTIGACSYVAESRLEFGSNQCHLLIGRYSSVAHDVIFLAGLNHDFSQVTTYPFDNIELDDDRNHTHKGNKKQIIIGNDVWIGRGVTILGGVHVCNGAVIGANSVVTKDVPPYAVVAGNPARIIKYRFSPDIIEKLQQIKWWNWPRAEIRKNMTLLQNPEAFCVRFYTGSMESQKQDDLGTQLAQLRQDGWKMYLLCADFHQTESVWKSVVRRYLDTFTNENQVMLLLAAEHSEQAAASMAEVQTWLAMQGDSAPAILSLELPHDKVELSLLTNADCYITTREVICSHYIDYAENSNVKIVSGLDRYIFGENPQGGKQPLLTIGVPTFNRAQCLEKCLAALAASIGDNDRFQVVISDNASTDDTPKVIAKYTGAYDNFISVRQQENIGGANNFRYLWQNAKGKFLMLLGDDDYIEAECLPYIGSALACHDEISVAGLIMGQEAYRFALDEGINAWLQRMSFIATSISCVIVNTKYIDVEAFDRKLQQENFQNIRLTQIVMILEILRRDPRFLCIKGRLFKSESGEAVFVSEEEYLEKGRAYGFPDLGRVFIQEYFDIYEHYRKYGIADETIQNEKAKLLKDFLLSWCQLSADKKVRWGAGKVLEIYDEYYRNEPYYHDGKQSLQKILKDLPAGIKEKFEDKYWDKEERSQNNT